MSSKVVENRVVSMDFDNSKFEKNTRETMGTLDKLRDKLGLLPRSAKGFEDVENASKRVTLETIGDALNGLTGKFSATGEMGRRFFQRLTDDAYDAGRKMWNSLVVMPPKTGFQEYETQINAVQTILANTSSAGTTLEEVNDALDQLNKYADLTIYNFTEMTRNIGTFTAAGIDLDTSVSAIQGIANLAAVSGSTSQQASTAMYQLSQALASGTVKLMDWNSVVNAGMGGQVFQDALKETARLYGVAIDEMIEYKGSFRETLSEGWLTSQILTETLKKFTTSGVNEYLAEYTGYSEYAIEQMREIAQESGDVSYAYREMAAELAESCELTEDQIYELLNMSTTAEDAATKVKTFTQLMDTLGEAMQSGWTQTWEIIIGDFEEAKELFTTISDVFGGIIEDISNARNSFLEEVMGSPWDKLTRKLDELGIYYSDFDLTVQEVAKNHGYNMDKIIEKYGSLEYAVRNGGFRLTYEMLYESFNKLISDTAAAQNGIGGVAGSLEEYGEIVQKVINGAFGNGANRIKALTDAGYDYELVQGLVDKRLGGLEITLDDLSDAQLKNLGYTTEQIIALREMALEAKELGGDFEQGITPMLEAKSGRQLILETLVNTLTAMQNIIYNVSDAWHSIFPKRDTTLIYRALEAINGLSKKLVKVTEDATVFRTILMGVFSGIRKIKDLITSGINNAIKNFGSNIGDLNISLRDIVMTIGGLIYMFVTWIKSFLKIDYVVEYTTKTFETIKQTIKDVGEKLLEIDMVSRLWSAYIKVLDKVKLTFNNIKKSVIELVETIKKLERFDMGAISEAFQKFLKNIGMNFVGKTVIEHITDFKDQVLGTLARLSTFVYDNISLADIFAVFTGATVIKAVDKALEIMTNIGKTMNELIGIAKNFGTAVNNVINSYAELLQSQAKLNSSQTLLNFALGMGIMVAAIIALAYAIRDNKEGVIAAGVAMGAVAAGLLILSAALSYMTKIGDLKQVGLSILAISIGILLIISAIKKLQKLTKNWDFVQNAGILGAIGFALAAMAVVMGKAAPSMTAGALSVLSLAVAINIMVKAVKTLSKIKEIDVKMVLGIITSLFIGLSVAMQATRGVKFSSAFTVLSIAMSIGVLVQTVKMLAKVPREELTAGLVAIKKFFASFLGIVLISKFSGKNAAKVGAMILSITSSMLILAVGIRVIGSLDNSDIAKAARVVEDIVKAIRIMVLATASIDIELGKFKFSTSTGKNAGKLALMILAVAGALAIISIALVALSHVNPAELQTATDSMTKIMGMFAVIIAISNINFGKLDIKSLKLMVVSIGIIAGALVMLALMDQSRVATAGQALAESLLSFAVTLFAMGRVSGKAVPGVLSLLIVIGGLAGVFYLLKDLDPVQMLGVVKALSLAMLSLAGCVLIIGYTRKFAGLSLITMVALVGVAALMVLAFKQLNELNPETIIPIASAMGKALLTLSVACLILAVSGTMWIGALAGIGILVVLLAAFYGIANWVADHVKDTEKIQNGIDNLCLISEGFGRLIGGIVSGFLLESTGSLPEVADNLTTFIEKVSTMLDTASGIKSDSLDNIETVTACIGLLMAEAFLNSILEFTTFFSGNYIENFSDTASNLGRGISGFIEALGSGFDKDDVDAASNAGLALAALVSSMPRNGGLVSLFIGKKNSEQFRQDLVALARGLRGFDNELGSRFDSDKVKMAANAGQAITALVDTIPASGGWKQTLLGSHDLGDFSDNLKTFGEGLQGFNDAILESFSADKVTSASNAGQALADLESSLPAHDGKLQKWVGDNNLGKFSKNLVTFGDALNEYSHCFDDGFSAETITNSTDAASSLASLEASLPDHGGKLQKWFGDADLSTFGKNIKSFAWSMIVYSNLMSNFDTDVVTATEAAVNTLLALDSSIKDENGGIWNTIKNVVGINTGIVDFGSNMELLGLSMSKFYGSMDNVETDRLSHLTSNIKYLAECVGVDMSNLDSFKLFVALLPDVGKYVAAYDKKTEKVDYVALTQTVSALADMSRISATISVDSIYGIATFAESLSQLGEANLQGFVDAYSDTADILSVISKFYDDTLEVMNNGCQAYHDAGANAVYSYRDGMSKNQTVIIICVRELINQINTTMNSLVGRFTDLGVRCVEGFANSINSHRSLASIAATNMANSAIAAARLTLGVHSPSRVFTEIGDYTGSAFTDTLLSYAKDSESAGNRLAEGAIEGLQNSISTLMMMLESGINTDIVITPVLDLSQIQNGTQTLASMLGYYDGGSFDLASGIARGINKRNADINMEPSAIEKLMSVLGNDLVPGDTYNNTFNITGDDPKAIADEVLYVFQKQIERKGATWA